ncbi:hypothetical protein [Phaeodactylibacter sp.]|uniref:hypothetical protein n=1 Tax=Phaeodactylibacter sp. TaxID=1940289 RepID=UPI0025DBE9CD|nr:hypothetical protein [Phaeodactylibacter sp.]MCI4649958.1 hypothetical protein [Phaeodactylibacter sp.]MCI5090188.1 hypothetical protein [Phaeodactylibacter sp.]
MKTHFSWITMALFLLTGSACEKEADLSNEDILVQSPWQLQSLQVVWQDGNATLQDETGPVAGTITFTADYKVVTEMPGSEPTAENWLMTAQTLQVGEETYTYTTLTEAKLVLETRREAVHPDDPSLGNITITERLTLIR